MEKINIAELLKDCPSGMELNCLMYEDVYFDYVDELNIIHCYIQRETHKTSLTFNYNGTPNCDIKSKCVIFPKGETTWEGFVPPCKFKDGDVCYIKTTGLFEHIFIFKVNEDYNHIQCHVDLSENYFFTDENSVCTVDVVKEIRLATKEEKQKLFDAIKDNGYKWNPETKTLEKLIEPKFKVGDKIIKRDSIVNSWIVSSVNSEYYGLKLPNGDECIGVMSIAEQDEYELVPNKFDVINFEPFMKVLVRSDNSDVWECDFFSSYNPKCSNRFHCIGAWYNICIPYIGNEHLRGTTNDCDDFYKTWE